MQGVKSKTMKSAKDLTKEDVLQIWTMRAGMNSNQDIAKKIGCQPWVSSDVITQGAGPVVPIPAEIKKAALQTVHSKKRATGYKRKPVTTEVPAVSLSVALANYTEACVNLEHAHRILIALGMDDDLLNLMAEAVKIQTAKEPK